MRITAKRLLDLGFEKVTLNGGECYAIQASCCTNPHCKIDFIIKPSTDDSWDYFREDKYHGSWFPIRRLEELAGVIFQEGIIAGVEAKKKQIKEVLEIT